MSGVGPALGKQVYFSWCPYRPAKAFLIASAAVSLSGCWVPPSASVRPQGPPRVVATGIEVDRVTDSATVESLDSNARMVALRVHGIRLPACGIGPRVRDWDEIRSGDQVRATVREVLSVYVGRGGLSDARVLVVDPSYRVLTVQYPNGEREGFKVGLRTRMEGIEAGDSVAIHPVQVIELRLRHAASPP